VLDFIIDDELVEVTPLCGHQDAKASPHADERNKLRKRSMAAEAS